ncbi:hypothetical protein TRVA0_046S00496 [Trichomonascus vanleenenianus]|uniref:uncharacterized protein n=1 Tax=Trichomonascus vanleenenianus TaxID=2268995 RepID=UPI003ECB0401
MYGTALKAFVALLVLLNYKSWPFMWHARFYMNLVRHFVIRRSIKPKQDELFKPNEYRTHTPLMEMDMNGHKSNSTYFSDLDMARADLLMGLFKDFFIHYRKEKKSWPFAPLGSVMTIFKKEIKAYKPYTIRSRVLGWDSKWLFVLSRFEFNDSKRTLAAVALSKYVFKLGRKTIPPEECVKICGLGSEENLSKGRMDFDKAKNMLQLEALSEEHM